MFYRLSTTFSQVVIRVRPPLPRELSGEVPFQNIVAVDEKEQLITISENIEAAIDENGQVSTIPGPYSTHSFTFDHVYDQHSTQKKVFETTARSVVDSALQVSSKVICLSALIFPPRDTMPQFSHMAKLEQARNICLSSVVVNRIL